MSYWTSERLKHRLDAEKLIDSYQEQQVTHCAYELTMGAEAFVTSTDGKTKLKLELGDPLVIPSGQFALLLTEEKVTIPLNAIGFISMRFSVKRKGLINVSGFHVDPGFSGRLKFAVYNAGSRDVTISRGDRVFVLWYADLVGEDGTTPAATSDGYGGDKPDHNTITSDDQNVMHGDVASPAELKKGLDDVNAQKRNILWVLSVFVALASAIGVRVMFMDGFFGKRSPSAAEVHAIIDERLKALALPDQLKAQDLVAINSRLSLACFSRDFDLIKSLYTDDARTVKAGEPEISGSAQVEAFWRKWLTSDVGALELKSLQTEVNSQGVVEYGEYQLRANDKSIIEGGKYVVVWKRVNGELKRHLETWTR